ncbi:hypothetical protein [Dyadobacter sp. CY347]|uniref:hypothetical protein n=1 Tax=Dyadobacter sp. CY347 TaxID=2909336 RepID=UPI001F2DBFF9|nr:hypothetical protein [Dyadobacter sp. CY347]MCF2487145.1 hypothetical protein [Dyadobacter sp. CY347]
MLNLFASAKLSYQIVVVYHELANEIFEDWFKKVRTKFGTKMVPMKEAMVRAMTVETCKAAKPAAISNTTRIKK